MWYVSIKIRSSVIYRDWWFIRGGHLGANRICSPLGTRRRYTHPCSHQSTSSSAISPFRFAACLSMPGTHRHRGGAKRVLGIERARRPDVTARRDAYRGFGVGRLRKIRPIDVRISDRLHWNRAYRVITKYIYTWTVPSRRCAHRIKYVDQTCRFFPDKRDWRTANIFCKTFLHNFRLFGICLEFKLLLKYGVR